MKKEIKWSTGDGREVIFTVTLVTEEELIADHTMTKPCCGIEYSATVAGKNVGDSWLQTVKPQTVGNVTVVAGIGNLGISQSNYDRIMAARKEIEECDYFKNWTAKELKAEKLEREYDEHVKRVDRMMRMGE